MHQFRLPSWREYYNPLRGLTLARLRAMEDAADRGQWADLQWFWHHMEQTDVTVQSAIARRLAFLDTLDWEIQAVEGADPALAAEQMDLLTFAYNRIENFADATRFLAGAIFRGYGHLDKIAAPDDERLLSRLEPIPQYYWANPHGGPWQLNPDTQPHIENGIPIDPATFIAAEMPPANRAIGRHFFAKTLALADWDQALELGAIQNIFFIGPPGATADKEAEYRAIAERMASNGRGYLPNGADVKIVDPANRGRLPYVERVDYCDRQIVMSATGGLLTMLAESGSGTLAGGAHSESLLALSRSDAGRLSEIYQRQLDALWLGAFFPGQPVAAYFQFAIPQTESTAALLEAAANLNWAGYRVDRAQLEEKTGLRLIDIAPPAQGAPQ